MEYELFLFGLFLESLEKSEVLKKGGWFQFGREFKSIKQLIKMTNENKSEVIKGLILINGVLDSNILFGVSYKKVGGTFSLQTDLELSFESEKESKKYMEYRRKMILG